MAPVLAKNVELIGLSRELNFGERDNDLLNLLPLRITCVLRVSTVCNGLRTLSVSSCFILPQQRNAHTQPEHTHSDKKNLISFYLVNHILIN